MAYSRVVSWWLLSAMAMAAVAFHLPAPASATYFLVGDKAGWTLNYTIGWPENKTFNVDDYLVFKYAPGNYTVLEVDSQTFKDCYRQGNTINEWFSGNDTVKLDKPGRRWFFSGLDSQCDLGLKLFVDVNGTAPPPDAPPPPVALPPPPPVALPPAPTPSSSSPKTPGSPPVTPAPAPSDQPSAALSRYNKVHEAVARTAVVAGAVVAAVLM